MICVISHFACESFDAVFNGRGHICTIHLRYIITTETLRNSILTVYCNGDLLFTLDIKLACNIITST